MTVHIPTVADSLAVLPKPTTEGAAGADLCSIDTVIIEPMTAKLVRTGLKASIPRGYAGFVCSRSGLALKRQIIVLNAPGIVDSDYRGDIGVILFNLGTNPFQVVTGDRIAQMLIMAVEAAKFVEVSNLPPTVRGEGGFGSTGISA
jgi:dUTP pyrophosphatase